MKIAVFVQALNVVPTPVTDQPRAVAVTFGLSDPDTAAKAGLSPQSSLSLTVLDAKGFAPGSEHVIEVKPT